MNGWASWYDGLKMLLLSVMPYAFPRGDKSRGIVDQEEFDEVMNYVWSEVEKLMQRAFVAGAMSTTDSCEELVVLGIKHNAEKMFHEWKHGMEIWGKAVA
jgi:hypothetical protein